MNKSYYEKNRDRVLERVKTYQNAHKEEILGKRRTYYLQHRVEILEARKIYAANNREKIAAAKKLRWYANREKELLRLKTYQATHRKERVQRHRERLAGDLNYRLQYNLRQRFYKALKGNAKRGSAIKDLGCSIAEFRFYIEGKFADGMSWANYGKWHLDHIIPLAYFDLSDPKQVSQVCHYTNYQPLWAADNRRKWKSIPYERQTNTEA